MGKKFLMGLLEMLLFSQWKGQGKACHVLSVGYLGTYVCMTMRHKEGELLRN